MAKVDTDCTEDYIGIESMYFRLKYLHMCSRGFQIDDNDFQSFLTFSKLDMASRMKHHLKELPGSRLEPCYICVILNFSASTTGCQSGGATFTSKYCGRILNSFSTGAENVPICGKW